MHQKENNYIKAFESKVIMYLFEYVMKMRPENIFIGHHKKNGKMFFQKYVKPLSKMAKAYLELKIGKIYKKGMRDNDERFLS